jgi:hypothetical protein
MKAFQIVDDEYLTELELADWARFLQLLDLAPSAFVALWRVALRLDSRALRELNESAALLPGQDGFGQQAASAGCAAPH